MNEATGERASKLALLRELATITTQKRTEFMWCDELPPNTSWSSLWRGLILCGRCSGIRHVDRDCSACGDSGTCKSEWIEVRAQDGSKARVPTAFMGAEGRFEDYIYLKMLEREWKRPLPDSDELEEMSASMLASPRAAIVLLFWSYFETRIEWLLRRGMQDVPANLAENTLRRYSFIGARDALVQGVVEKLKTEHEAWIAAFNRRAAKPPQ